MADEIASAITLCKNILNTDYKGDPLELESFVNKVEMLKLVATSAPEGIVFTYVKSKLSAKALEAIRPSDTTIDQLVTSLRERIKPENSNVIKGKMCALRLANRPLQDFAKQAEELSESFKRPLIIEGFPENKAQEMTIEKTIDICRESAHSEVVKAVLASSQFKSAQEVVSKFITETDKNRNERQVLTVRKFNSQNKQGGFNQSFRGRQNPNNNNGRSYGNWNNFRNNGSQNSRNNNNFRGPSRRGNDRGGRFNGNQFRQNNGYGQSNQNNVRAITAGPENALAPPNTAWGRHSSNATCNSSKYQPKSYRLY